MPTPNSRSRS
ncbi:hypothetical protein Celaphus_00001857 [Cervus elaphus hippelaphus]|uniref:Uncharacterized protein n=1 Tax=Cervus elaphus hippelaphus TaxID=46360 RepID=A0A212CHP8_CEREH|nr:hypothetical protein Celaphus_00001857 [Cervus elaphus hippelaphus]